MAGFREFVTGEILTAANVDDFLAKQVVQKYADAAARDAALGTAVAGGNALREGMVSYLDDENEVQYFDGTVWDAISQPIAGIGSNVVQTVKTNTFTTTSTSPANVTGMSVAITPTSDTSKILVIAHVHLSIIATDVGQGSFIRLTGGNSSDYVGDAAGSRQRAAGWTGQFTGDYRVSEAAPAHTIVWLDNPATASSVTYQVQAWTSAATAAINRAGVDTNTTVYARLPSSITAIEVAP